MTLELIPLCTVAVVLDDFIVVGDGPAGTRLIAEVKSATVTGARLNGSLKGAASADWITMVGSIVSLDVRVTFETDDGAIILSQYRGRTDFSTGGGAPIYVAPTFETGDERYAWLNLVQAVGKGTLDGPKLDYEWYEVR
jgi:hypothetical protein